MATLVQFLAHVAEESDPELPPGTPPTCKLSSVAFFARSRLPKTSSKVLGSRHRHYSHHLSESSRFCCSAIVDPDGHCSSPLAPSSKVLTTLACLHNSPPLAGFSPHEAHAHAAFFGWIMPTLRTSEYTVLQIVGLDAAVVSPSCNE